LTRQPSIPPQPWFDPKTGAATNAFYRYITGERGGVTNINSGLNETNANVQTAIVTAQAASSTAQAAQTNPFALTANSAYCSALSDILGPQTTSSVTVTPSGGVAPYTYAWTKVSGDTVTIDSPAAATTTFTGTPPENSTLSGTYKCTVTDSTPASAIITVGVNIAHFTVGP
jgi:hypothetical protein